MAETPDDTERSDHSWRKRDHEAWLLRVAIHVAPSVGAAATGLLLAWALPSASGVAAVLRWMGIFVVSLVVLALIARAARRFLPLAALLEMSIRFPGRAPARYAIARKVTGPQSVQRLLAEAEAAPEDETLVDAAGRILALVGALRSHDRQTRGHSERVLVLTEMVALEMGLDDLDREKLRWAALLHDIGKITIPVEILNKPGKPTEEEWVVLRGHPEEGLRLTRRLLPWLGEWGHAIAEHHERYDGTGYPFGLAGADISLGARIVAATDAYEVMTAARAYKEPMSREAALQELARCSGTHFDPVVVRHFVAVGSPRPGWVAAGLTALLQVPLLASSVGGTAGGVVATAAGRAATGVAVLGAGTALALAPAPVVGPPMPPPSAEPAPEVARPVPVPVAAVDPAAVVRLRPEVRSVVLPPSLRPVPAPVVVPVAAPVEKRAPAKANPKAQDRAKADAKAQAKADKKAQEQTADAAKAQAKAQAKPDKKAQDQAADDAKAQAKADQKAQDQAAKAAKKG